MKKQMFEMQVNFTSHSLERIEERYTGTVDIEKVLKGAKICKSTMLRFIRMKCKQHAHVTNRSSDYIYWYSKDKKEKLWRIFITKAKGINNFTVLTYFELDYSEFY